MYTITYRNKRGHVKTESYKEIMDAYTAMAQIEEFADFGGYRAYAVLTKET